MKSQIRRYLISGLLVWLPIWVTYLAIRFLMDLMDKSLTLLPHAYRPDSLLGFHIPGLGLIFTILVLFFTGMIVTNFLGRFLLIFWDQLIERIPFIRSIYMGVKKTLEVMLSGKGTAFRKVVLVEFPRKGSWSLAFQTSQASDVIAKQTQDGMITVFVPTTPNPTSGFILLLPKSEVREVAMTIDEALKMIISLGVVQPNIVVK
jgi:uncharacterized membrane protein